MPASGGLSFAKAAGPAVMAAADDGLPLGRRGWAHVAIGVGVAMSVIDGSIANVALPTLARALKVSAAQSIWVVNAYQLSVCMSLLILGSLGDIFGYDRVFRCCLVLFTAASLGCALSHGLTGLAAARFVQGVGGAGMLGVTNAMLRGIYPRRELAAGIGRNTVVVALSLTAGPGIASAILSVAPWPWLFAINVPIGVAAFFMSRRLLPSFPRGGQTFDVRAAVLSAAAFAGAVLGINGLGHRQGQGFVAVAFAAAVLCGTALFRRQAIADAPLLPIDLLRIRLFRLSVGTTFLASMAQLMAYVALPFLFHALGRGPVRIGLLFTPWPVMVALVAPTAGRLARKTAPGLQASCGLIILALGLVLLALLPHGAGAGTGTCIGTLAIIWRMLLCGFGYGIFLPPNASTQIAVVPRARSGGASTLGATARVLGQSIGAALAAGIFGWMPLHGIAATLFIAAGIAVAGALISLFRTVPE